MTAYTDEEVAALAEGLLDHSLPKDRWTHAAHLAATLRLVRTRDAGLERDLPRIIRSYNVAVGGVNDDHNGYHETITQAYLAAIRGFAAALPTAPATARPSSACWRRRWGTRPGRWPTGRASACSRSRLAAPGSSPTWSRCPTRRPDRPPIFSNRPHKKRKDRLAQPV